MTPSIQDSMLPRPEPARAVELLVEEPLRLAPRPKITPGRGAGCWDRWILVTLLLVFGADIARGQEPDKKYAKEYQHAFKGDPPNPADVWKMGPGNAECVKFEPEGLRISLPLGVPGNQAGTGVTTGFGVSGDFEITIGYEILQEPEPADAGAQTRFALVVVLDKANPNQFMASLNRRVVPKEGRQYFSWLMLGPADTGKREGRTTPAKAKSGRLRLLREGDDLSYLMAEGDDDAFKLLAKFPLGAEDVKEVRIVATKSGEKAAIDVRIRDLHIRAAAFPKPAPKIAEPLQAPKAEYAQEYYHSFKGNPEKPAGWDYQGPDAAKCVQFEREGLHIALQAGWEGERPGTGVHSRFRVHGDFEITIGFDILKAPAPTDLGKGGTRLSLAVVKDTPHKNTPHVELATHSRSISPQNGTIFVNWMRRRNARDDADVIQSKIYPTTATSGRLRLIRSGSELFYLKAEGADDPFKVLSKFTFGAEDLQRIQIAASTGGEKATLDARVTDVRVRAQALPNAPATDLADAPTPPDMDGRAQSPARGWRMAALLIGAAIVIFIGLVAGAVLVLRQRRPTAQIPAGNQPAGAEAASAIVAVACAGCGKKLKARAEWAGRKVKCPQCGKAVAIPAKASDPE